MSLLNKTNRLAQETSPYLRQHAHNPVDWYSWNPEALEKAKCENKPILLSIGYAACHWCHVMAHESFEDEATAKLMNQLFINIKVDREERPDLDKIYQNAHYLLTQQSGGWPLTIFLTPDDLVPFFSGTYFPRESRYQLPAFRDVLTGLANAYQQHGQEIRQQNAELLKVLNHQTSGIENASLNSQPLQLALTTLQQHYDPTHGGFNGAPKFPQAPKLRFLVRQHSAMASATLQHMAQGGINDQLAGGFYRYSIDAEWQIPHFEKMLYDNAQLLFLYSQASQKDANPAFAQVARATAEWVIQDMQSQEGGYYSSLDADSEGHEGKFYVWDKKEAAELLAPEEYKLIESSFGLDQAPNFEEQWHLRLVNIPAKSTEKLFVSAKEKMLHARKTRVSPAYDTKILTAWNALMIKGLLTAGSLLDQPRYIESAQKALAFIQKKLWVNHRLLASYNDNKAHLAAYLDDYVFLIDALLASLEISWNSKHLQFAIDLTEIVLTHFSDTEGGGFFFTADDHEKLLYRPKSMMDEAIPSGNGIAVQVLLRLGHLLGETRYLDAAEKTLCSSWPALSQYPAEHCSLLLGLNDFLEPPPMIVIRGKPDEIKTWQEACKSTDNFVLAIPNAESDLPGSLGLKTPQEKTCAYVCKGMQCLKIIEDIRQLRPLDIF